VAYLTRSDSFTAGVMISASHNPYRDNGIKVFGHSGYKLPDDEEHAIEQEIFRHAGIGLTARAAAIGADPLLAGATWITWPPPWRAASMVCASCSIAATARPTNWRRRCSAASARRWKL
jgi:hypothetical protein